MQVAPRLTVLCGAAASPARLGGCHPRAWAHGGGAGHVRSFVRPVRIEHEDAFDGLARDAERIERTQVVRVR